jgi:membrane-bound lytic murein transglycosylase C
MDVLLLIILIGSDEVHHFKVQAVDRSRYRGSRNETIMEKIFNKANCTRKWFLIPMVFLVGIFCGSILWAEDPFEKLDKTWETEKERMDRQWENRRLEIDKKWDALKREQEEKWERMKAEVEQKWQEYTGSTRKDWVDYNPDKDTRSRTDFKKGQVIFETVIPVDDPEALENARRKIKKQAERVFNRKDMFNRRVLDGQVVNRQGEKVDLSNLNNYIRKDVLPEINFAPQPFQSRDGVKRRRYSVKINLVPDNIRIRARRYLPIVEKNAKRFYLKPQLVLSIIHTESYFNPFAVSSCDAVGIMQIIPRYAGREAYQALYGKDTLISRGYLFNPENNIELGCAYLYLLKNKHFKDVPGVLKNRYVSICGYNWGPTYLRKKIVDKYPISQMSDRQVYFLLRQKTPRETSNYIKRVTERMPIYDHFF